MNKTIDPRTTRRRIPATDWQRNAARYATYKPVGTDGHWLVLERKPEFIKRAHT